jgi:acyl carrier protein
VEKELVLARIVTQAIDELNLQRATDQQLSSDPDAPLFGAAGRLDSLGLVLLISEVENRLEEAFGQRINLADEELLARDESPFASAGALRQYLATIL